MSGGPGGGSPPCVEQDFSREFFTPLGADIYHPGDAIAISWYAGKAPDSQHQTQPINLLLSLGGGATDTTILSKYDFSYPSVGSSAAWTSMDVCANTKMTYYGTLPTNITAGSGTKYTMYAMNASSTPAVVLAESSLFLIQAKAGATSSSTSSSSTLPATGSSPTSPTSPPATNTPDTGPSSSGLSTAQKAGIGVGVPIAALLLALGAWFLWRRRKSGLTSSQAAERYEKAELDGKTEAPRNEAGGAEIMEMDGDAHYWAGAEPQSEPAELYGESVGHQEMSPRVADAHDLDGHDGRAASNMPVRQ